MNHSRSSLASVKTRRADLKDRPIAAALALPAEHVDVIEQSHERSAAFGLSRIERPDFSPLARPDLSVARERNLRLHSHAAPVMEMLFDQIVNTESMVLLCDATGTVIHSIGDDDFLSRASKVALAPGANWSESAKGTNAVGTALVAEAPTLVHADEHFLHANHFLTCSAAPIMDPRGNILGVLDVSGDRRSYHQHTMALVKMSARMIENHWLSDDYRNAMRLHFHGRVGFIGTLMEGILAVSQDGRIVGANRGALEQLGLSGAALRMQSLVSLFGTTVGALVDRFRSPLSTPLEVQTDNGRSFFLHARFNWPVWSTVAEAAAATTPGPAADSPAHASAQAGSNAPAAVAAARGETLGLAHLQTGDAQLNGLIDKVRRVLDRDIPILLLGETGTGKELLARAIHADSARSRQPFVAVNCASIPETLIEAELFGYEEGAFTGARRKGAVGKILQAHGGTLFLDEIGDMPLALQAHLLRVLQERQVTPLASSKSVPVDVAIICATHRNLRDMIDNKLFREDLYYRLNGLAVRLPPLRERSDLPVLVRRILDGESGGRHLRLGGDALRLFEAFPWPGNVRQLFNVLRTAVVMAGTDAVLGAEHLPDDFLEDARAHLATTAGATGTSGVGRAGGPGRPESLGVADPGSVPGFMAHGGASAQMPSGEALARSALGGAVQHAAGSSGALQGAGAANQPLRSLDDMALDAIAEAVRQAGGNISVAAKNLGVSRNTIYRKLRWSQRDSA